MASRGGRREYHYDRETEQTLERLRSVASSKDFSETWIRGLTLFHQHVQPVARVYLKWNLGDMFDYPVVSHPEPWSQYDFVKVLFHAHRTFGECGIHSAFARHVIQLDTLVKQQSDKKATIDDALRLAAVVRSIVKLFPDDVPKEAEKEVTREERLEAEEKLRMGKGIIQEHYNKLKEEIESKCEGQTGNRGWEREGRNENVGWGGSYGLRHERSRSYEKGDDGAYGREERHRSRRSRDGYDSGFRDEGRGRRDYDSRAGGDRYETNDDRSNRGSRSFHEKGSRDEEDDRRGHGWDERHSKRPEQWEKYPQSRRGERDPGDRYEAKKGGRDSNRMDCSDSYDQDYAPAATGWGTDSGDTRRRYDDTQPDDAFSSRRDLPMDSREAEHERSYRDRDRYDEPSRHESALQNRESSDRSRGHSGYEARGYSDDPPPRQHGASDESGLSQYARMQLPKRPPPRMGPHGPNRTASGDSALRDSPSRGGGRDEHMGRSFSDMDRWQLDRQSSWEREDAQRYQERGSPPSRKYSERQGFGHQYSGRREFERSQESSRRDFHDRQDYGGGGGGDDSRRSDRESRGGWSNNAVHSFNSREREREKDKERKHADRERRSDHASGWGSESRGSGGGGGGWGRPAESSPRKSDSRSKKGSTKSTSDNPWGVPPSTEAPKENPWGAVGDSVMEEDNPWAARRGTETRSGGRESRMKDDSSSKRSQSQTAPRPKENPWGPIPEKEDEFVDNPWSGPLPPSQGDSMWQAPAAQEKSKREEAWTPQYEPETEPLESDAATKKTTKPKENPWGALPEPVTETDNPWGMGSGAVIEVPAVLRTDDRNDDDWGMGDHHDAPKQGNRRGAAQSQETRTTASSNPWHDPANMNLTAWNSAAAPIWTSDSATEPANSNTKVLFSTSDQEKHISSVSDLASAPSSGRSSGSKKLGPPPGFESKMHRSSSSN